MQVQRGDAIWKNKDVDQPVKVIGYYGKHGGRHYVKIEGSSTGVPLDELSFGKGTSISNKYTKGKIEGPIKPNGGGHKYHEVDMSKVFGGGSDIKTVKIPTKVTRTLEAADKTTRKISGKIHKKADIRGIRQKMIKNAIAKESAEWAAKTVEWGRYGIIGTAAVIGVTGILDSYNDAQNQHRIQKQQRIQERNLERKYEKEQQDQYIGMGDLPQHQGLVQQLFNNRIGHTNSWGGRRY